MDSARIADFLESTYPDPAVPLTSELGREIEAQSRKVVSTAFGASVLPREMGILSPRAQEYFRRTREAALGHPLEDLLDPEREEQAWAAVDGTIREVGELMLTHQAEGPFILGARPSYTDFFIAGALQSARTVHEGVFERLVKYPGYREVYEACVPFMQRKN
jgi:glutathione S-transferase